MGRWVKIEYNNFFFISNKKMIDAIVNFLSPKEKTQQQVKRQQLVQKPQQVVQKQQQVVEKQQQFVPKQNMPVLKQTSQTLHGTQGQKQQEQFKTTTQLTDAITQQVNKQARQSRQQLAQMQHLGLKQAQLEQAKKAHSDILSYATQARTLLEDIRAIVNKRQQQNKQMKRQTQKIKNNANVIVVELRNVLEQMSSLRQQNKRVQQKHIRQLQNIKTTLLDQGLLVPSQQVSNKKVVQHITPDGNKFRISVDVKPDAKCCIAQALGQRNMFKKYSL